MGLSRCPVPVKLVDPSEGEEEPEGIDNDQFLQQLSGVCDLHTLNCSVHDFLWLTYLSKLCMVDLLVQR